MFKAVKNLYAPLVSELFERRNNVYDLQNPSEFVLPKVHSVFHGIGSISYLYPQIWKKVPLKMKKLTTINVFTREVKKHKLENCPCNVNHTYKA